MGVLLGIKISGFGWKRCVFFRPKSAKMGCFLNLGTSVIYALVGSWGPGATRRRRMITRIAAVKAQELFTSQECFAWNNGMTRLALRIFYRKSLQLCGSYSLPTSLLPVSSHFLSKPGLFWEFECSLCLTLSRARTEALQGIVSGWKWWEFPPITWTYNALQITDNASDL